MQLSGSDHDYRLSGCGSDETLLDAADARLPVVEVRTNGDFTLSGFAVVGGTDALTLDKGAFVEATDVVSRDSAGVGVRIAHPNTVAWLRDVWVDGTTGAGCGFGIAAKGATVFMDGGGVSDATGVGLFGDNVELFAGGVTISDTAPDARGKLGRALHAQKSLTVFVNGTLENNLDASALFLDPKGTWISQVVIDITGAGFLAGGSETGDGIVFMSRSSQRSYAYLRDNAIFGSTRAAVVFDNQEAFVKGNTANGTGLFTTHHAHAFKQAGSVVTGPDAGTVMDLGSRSSPDALTVDDSLLTCR